MAERNLLEPGSFLDLLAALPSPWLMLAGDSNMRHFWRRLIYNIARLDDSFGVKVAYVAPTTQHRNHPAELVPPAKAQDEEEDDGPHDPARVENWFDDDVILELTRTGHIMSSSMPLNNPRVPIDLNPTLSRAK